jgi:hypothetical protein
MSSTAGYFIVTLDAEVAVDPLHGRALLGLGALGDQVVDARVAQLDLAYQFARDVGPGRLGPGRVPRHAAPTRRSGGALLIGLGLATLLGGLVDPHPTMSWLDRAILSG